MSEAFNTLVTEFGAIGVLIAILIAQAGCLAYVVWRGGQAFMALANRFSSDVVQELREIKDAIVGQEKRVDELVTKIQAQNERLDRIEDRVSR